MTETDRTETEAFIVDPDRLRRYAGEKFSDPGQPGYYARRGVTDEVEQQMRADAVRAARLLEQARKVGTRDEYVKFSDPAGEIRSRWANHESDVVRASWEYLDDAREDWRRSPGAMEQLYEEILIDRVDSVTGGMSPNEWWSQRQAREMGGHGPWPEARDPFSIDAGRTRPTSAADPACPSHYADAADRAEQVMRADFAQVYRLDRERGQTYTDSEYVQLTEQMHDIAEPWVARIDELGETWRDMRWLSSGSYGSRGEYADAVERIEQYRREDNPLFTRSATQVGELTGIVRPHRSTAAPRTPETPVSSAFAAARTAELRRCGRAPIPGHPFAGLVAGHEREGIER
ncbi:hypothetical protein ACWCPQ_21265 [Nocardia sp. NPDC001965]